MLDNYDLKDTQDIQDALKQMFSPVSVPRDRQGQFEPQIVKKYQRNVSSIEGKVLAMYARGVSQRMTKIFKNLHKIFDMPKLTPR